MPKKTIWIREEDLDVWDGIDDRPGFIHDILVSKKYSSQPQVIDKIKKIQEVRDLAYCEHGYGIGLCKYDKCNRKYK